MSDETFESIIDLITGKNINVLVNRFYLCFTLDEFKSPNLCYLTAIVLWLCL